MSHYVSAEEHRAKEVRFVERIYRLRRVGVLACGVTVAAALVGHGQAYGAWIWLALLLNTVLWPWVALSRARKSTKPLVTEQWQLVFDGLFGGLWIAIIGISPIPSSVLVCALMAGRASSGEWRIVVGMLLMLLAGVVVGWLGLGRPWWPNLPIMAIIVCMASLVFYIFALSYTLRTQVRLLLLRNEELQRQNRTDASIELPNRRYFLSRLALAYGRYRHYEHVASLLLIDVDHFKGINDRFGHQAGDRILNGVADILRIAVRSGDLPARYGGDEFAVLLINANRRAAKNAAERICSMLASYNLPDGSGMACTVSIGVAEITMEHISLHDWVNAADTALYQAKAAGRNQIVVAS